MAAIGFENEDTDDKEDDSDDSQARITSSRKIICSYNMHALSALPQSPKLDSQFGATYGRSIAIAIKTPIRLSE